MRARGLWLVTMLCAVLAASGCKNKTDADASPDPEALKAQQQLIARRDALLAARQKLQQERDELATKIQQGEASGSDVADLKKQKAEVDTQLESNTSDLVGQVSSALGAMKASGDKAANLAGREAALADREKAVAEREARIADREKSMSQREVEAAQRWKDTCNAGAAPVIIQQAPPKSGSYSKKDVTDMIAKAKAVMNRKGLIGSDLGPNANLEAEAVKDLADNDISRAVLAATQLVASVDAITVNRAFIQAKTARLQAQLKSSRVDEATNQQLSAILSTVMDKYNNGDFAAANRQLNALAQMLNK